jgi:hypothetical protein
MVLAVSYNWLWRCKSAARFCGAGVALLACLCGRPLCAEPAVARVAVVGAEVSAAHTQVAQTLAQRLAREGLTSVAVQAVALAEVDAAAAEPALAPLRFWIGLGVDACAQLMARPPPAPVLCALIPRASFERLLRTQGRKASGQLSALVLDQPLARQLALIGLALPQARRVGVLWGPDSSSRAASLRTLAVGRGMSLVEASDAGEGMYAPLMQVLESDVLLAMADPAVYNSQSVQNILLASIRARVPMVGFSPAYVRSGALLAIYTAPAQVGEQLAGLLAAALRTHAWPASPVDPEDFELAVNERVAQSLGLSLAPAALRLGLKRLEAQP